MVAARTTEFMAARARVCVREREAARGGTYFLHLAGEPAEALTDDQIRTRTAAALQLNPATPVLVRADKNINYGKVIQAMVLLQQGGAPKVGLATELPEQSE
jgi:biopolymer transport protein TolR